MVRVSTDTEKTKPLHAIPAINQSQTNSAMLRNDYVWLRLLSITAAKPGQAIWQAWQIRGIISSQRSDSRSAFPHKTFVGGGSSGSGYEFGGVWTWRSTVRLFGCWVQISSLSQEWLIVVKTVQQQQELEAIKKKSEAEQNQKQTMVFCASKRVYLCGGFLRFLSWQLKQNNVKTQLFHQMRECRSAAFLCLHVCVYTHVYACD